MTSPASSRDLGTSPRSSSLRIASLGRSIWQTPGMTLLPVVVAALVLGTIINSNFMTASNLINNVVASSAALGLLVIAEALMLIGGYFDLSLQSTVAFSVILLAVLVSPGGGTRGFGLPLALALVITIAAVACVGLINGLLVSFLRLNAFIVTLAMLILVQGIQLGISGGQTYTGLPGFITYLGSGELAGIPFSALLLVAAFIVVGLFMRFTPTGRYIYAMGGSEEAAIAVGVRTRMMTVGLFVFGALMAMVAGMVLAGKTFAATATLGDNIIFTVFAAAVLGGVSLNGGRGSMLGAFFGVILLAIIQNILTLSNVPSFWINAAYGAIILGALLIGRLSGVTKS